MKKILALLLGTAFLFGVFSVAGCSGSKTKLARVPLEYTEYKSSTEDSGYDEEIIYRNDLTTTGADPSVIYIEEGDQAGYFYMYVTGIGRGYECFRSKDLNTWEKMGVAYECTEFEEDGILYLSFAEYSHWAPEVIYDEDLGLYMLFYSAGYRYKDLAFYLDCAVSENPQGPFVQYAVYIQNLELSEEATEQEREELEYWKQELAPYRDDTVAAEMGREAGTVYLYPPLIDFRNMRAQKEGESESDYISAGSEDGYMKVIDACPFIDPVSGNKYLYFVRDLGESGETQHQYSTSSIGVIAMDEDWRPLLDENNNYASVKLLTEVNRQNVGDGLENSKMNEGDVNEGPYMLYNEENGKYYLLYSCNSYWQKTYSVRVAVGDSPDGPFTKLMREEGGWLLYADPSCGWISGTGHNSVATKNGKQYIVYHEHTNRVTGDSTRAVGFDELVWVTNEDGLLIPHVNGGSYSYMPQTTGEWSNIAPEASISSSNVKEGSDAKYANDGAVKFHDDGVIYELEMNKDEAEITLTFEDYREVRALFVFNSYFYEKSFGRITNIEFTCKDESGNAYIAYTETLDFDWDQYYVDDEYIPGGSFVIGFEPMLVQKIVIHLPASEAERAISDIVVLGK